MSTVDLKSELDIDAKAFDLLSNLSDGLDEMLLAVASVTPKEQGRKSVSEADVREASRFLAEALRKALQESKASEPVVRQIEGVIGHLESI
jgi:hypothetical protein